MIQAIIQTIIKMFDTQREWIGWALAFLTVYMGIVVIEMSEPTAMHMQAFGMVLGALCVYAGLTKTIPGVASINKGLPPQ